MLPRRKTKIVRIGSVKIGGECPISIQSMTKTATEDVSATLKQIQALEQAGCEIIRVALKNKDALGALAKIRKKTTLPLVADIHFNYQLALQALASGVDAIRLNPGNIYRKEEVQQIAKACKKRKIPIRVGVNSGSLRTTHYACLAGRQALRTTNFVNAMVKSALDYTKLLENYNFRDIIISLKASDVVTTVAAYRQVAARCSYPLHLGITASGLPEEGKIKSAIGIGSLLLEGIGDTIRVSLTGSPLEEVRIAKQILQAAGRRNFGPEIISCPTCGRTQVNIMQIAQEVKKKLDALRTTPALPVGRHYALRPIKIAIMGCEVNGPGEAKEADLGVACGRKTALLFKKGKPIKTIPLKKIAETLLKELKCYGLKA